MLDATFDLETPGSVYNYSPRPDKKMIEEEVDPNYCKVHEFTNRLTKRMVMVSKNLCNKSPGLEESEGGIWQIYFR